MATTISAQSLNSAWPKGNPNSDPESNEWLEPVTDEQYAEANF